MKYTIIFFFLQCQIFINSILFENIKCEVKQKYVFFPLQRDLDFTIEVDFKGELSEMKETMQYKMR